MTEAEWLRACAPKPLLLHIQNMDGLQRKLRLAASACCARLIHLLNDVSRWALEANELFADDERNDRELAEARRSAEFVSRSLLGLNKDVKRSHAAWAVWAALRQSPKATANRTSSVRWAMAAVRMAGVAMCKVKKPWDDVLEEGDPDERRWQASIVRDIFGNPFRLIAFDPAWRTSTAVALAKEMYESRDFSPMPILADALQDAGCENDDVLNHCREANATHVRGCWVVDLVLSKS